MVYDLLCVQMPHFFPPHSDKNFSTWLSVVLESDGAVCISNSVAEELATVVNKSQRNNKNRVFKINSNHLGADLRDAQPSNDVYQDNILELEKIKNNISFLMVGTLEPRKGHLQVLDAFECLWKADMPINLVIAGKKGWMVDDLVERLSGHSELNTRLFWLQGISDKYLERVYAESTCLIAASYGEGFGLPLIEAAQHKLPVIARDIPVFREVAGDHAYYFKVEQPYQLAKAIESWLSLMNIGQHPNVDNMPWLTWYESTAQLSKELNLTCPIATHIKEEKVNN
jgi:glycosyltransferase involved in cell wall biosynthesis